MHPERAARFISTFGVYLLVAALILRVVSLVTISWQARMGLEVSAVQPTHPTIGQYRPSPDRTQVLFTQQIDAAGNTGWFSMPLEGGPVSPADAQQVDISPFVIEDQQVFVEEGEDLVKVNGLPNNSDLITYARSPDKEILAFVKSMSGDSAGLFLLSAENNLYWLGDHDMMKEIAWSPDSQNLAFLADVDGVSQLFIIRRDGQVEHQLTTDSTNKSSLRWSPDGRSIAYLAAKLPEWFSEEFRSHYYLTPPPENSVKWGIQLIGIDGANQRQLIEDERLKFNLDWGMEGSEPVLLYSIPLPKQIKSSTLYTLNPQTGRVRKAYPPLEITAFTCPARTPVTRPGTFQITINNTGLRQVNVPLVLRARSRAFPAQNTFDADVVRSEKVQVPPGSSLTVEWPLPAQPGLFTHTSAGVNPFGLYAMDEHRCTSKNSYFGLPNLPFLALMLPLVLVGTVLCIPWLRIKKKSAVWALYLAFPVFTLVILLLETRLVGL